MRVSHHGEFFAWRNSTTLETDMKQEPRSASKAALTIFVGKWTPKVLSMLREKSRRHGELRRRLRNISQRMLTRTLRNLESAGLIARHTTNSKPFAVQYSLTRLGKTFVGPLTTMCRWAKQHQKGLSAVVRLLEPDGNNPDVSSQSKQGKRHLRFPAIASE